MPRRRHLLGGAAALALPAAAQPAPPPLRLLDLSGSVMGAQMLDGFAAARPGRLSGVTVRRDHVTALLPELRASVLAGQPMADLVLTGLDGVQAGAFGGLWQPVSDRVQALAGPLEALLAPLAAKLRGVARDQAQVIAASPGGPLLLLAPGRVPRAPRSAPELLQWARENPGRFLYPRPDLAEDGRCFVAGLPWMLGDADPTDPIRGWPATWAFLAELDRHVPYYPTSTLAAQQEMAEGGVDIIATTLGQDILSRARGLLPADTALAALEGMHWIPVGLFVAVPRGLPEDRQDLAAAAIAWLLDLPFQRMSFGHGLMWPGPVRRDVTLDQAPPGMQAELRRLVRPATGAMVAASHAALPLLLEENAAMLRRWDAEISAWHGVRP